MQFDLSSYAITMAEYNHWMNSNLYSVIEQLDEDMIKVDRGLFFGSIYSTLNHLLVCDLIWLARFKSEPVKVFSLTQDLFESFEKMKSARSLTDANIISWAHSLSLSSLPKRLAYRSLRTNAKRDIEFSSAIVHFFNHQTHHRGQLTAALSQENIDYGVTDIIFMP